MSKDFLHLRDLSRSRIESLVELAYRLQRSPGDKPLADKVVGLLFMNPSLRTLASFQAGVAQLGGNSFIIQPGAGSWTLETRDGTVMEGAAQEHVREAIPVLAEYCDILAARSFAKMESLQEDLRDGFIQLMASLSTKPFINMESASDHPCQALADWKTMDDLDIPHEGGKFVLSWAWHPKPLPFAVPRAALTMAALRGMDVTILRPEGYDLPHELIEEAEQLGAKNLTATSCREAAMQDAHVMYVKSWCASETYADAAKEVELRSGLREWCVDESWFSSARPEAKFMHCLPVRRNVKVADEVLDGPRSVVVQQAGNRLHAQKAVLAELATGGVL